MYYLKELLLGKNRRNSNMNSIGLGLISDRIQGLCIISMRHYLDGIISFDLVHLQLVKCTSILGQ